MKAWRVAVALACLVSLASAQAGMTGGAGLSGGAGITAAGGGGGGTWALVQHPKSASCSGASASCTVTLSQNTTASTLLTVWVGIYSSTSGIKIASVSGGGSWNLCSGSACAATISCCGANVMTDQAYNTAATGGAASVTITVDSAPGNTWTAGVNEYSYSGASKSYDGGNNTTSTNCTSCAGPTLTMSGNNDVIVQTIAQGNTITAISAPYTNPDDSTTSGMAGAINQATYSQPTWTQNAVAPAAMSALAIKGN